MPSPETSPRASGVMTPEARGLAPGLEWLLKDPVALERLGRLHAGLDRVAHFILGVYLCPRALDHRGFRLPRHHHHSVLVGEDQVARREDDAVKLHCHVDVDDALTILA